jgi:hypothetical protein
MDRPLRRSPYPTCGSDTAQPRPSGSLQNRPSEAGLTMGHARWWVAAALTSWAAVGAIAWETGRLKPVLSEAAAWTDITEAQIAEIRFDGLPGDNDIAAPMAPPDLDPAQAKESSHSWRRCMFQCPYRDGRGLDASDCMPCCSHRFLGGPVRDDPESVEALGVEASGRYD